MAAPLHQGSTHAEWEAAAAVLRQKGEDITGDKLRHQTLLADRLIDEIFREDEALDTWNGVPKRPTSQRLPFEACEF